MTRDDYLWDKSGDPDRDTQRLEQLLGEFRYRRPHRPVWQRPTTWIVVPLAAAAIIILTFTLQSDQSLDTAIQWTASAALGTPTADHTPIVEPRVVSDGQWLDTDGTSRLRIDLGGYGEVLLEPGSRLRIVSTDMDHPRLQLTEGMLHAALWAPEDVSIETPSAVAMERDGEFVVAINEDDRVCLSVNVGRVMMREGSKESIVPAGAVCEAYPESGPGTPFCESAPDRFRQALESYDLSRHGTAGLDRVLGEAGTCDLVPLWHLLQRVDSKQRGRIFDHMAELQPPPDGVTRAGINRLDSRMLDRWWNIIRHHHSCLICTETSGLNSHL
ncbi:MAG: hypothetical protein GF341_07055 [candidate division Zixibacteria bacterium]|nr:hypothetical protein [candidate division Zixibacteria bacterium]